MSPTGDGVTTCPKCGARFPSTYVQGCIRCGWRKAFQHYPHSDTEPADGNVPSSPAYPEISGSAPLTARPRNKKVMTAAVCLLTLLALAVAGFYGYGYICKEQGEAEKEHVKQQYGRLLTEAKNHIFSEQLETAAKRLQDALDLTGAFDRSDAELLLAEVKKASTPVEASVNGLSDADLLAICQSGSLPQAYHLTYPPLDTPYEHNLLLACYKEHDRRQAASDAAKKASQQRAEAEKTAQEAKAEAERQAKLEAERKARETDVPAASSGTTTPGASTSLPAKVRLINGTSVSGIITDCQGGEIKVTFTNIAGDNPSATLKRSYQCCDIASIEFATPDAALQKKILKTALVVDNGVLALAMACSMSNDPTMKALSENQEFIKAVADVRAATTAYPPLARNVSVKEARIVDLDKQMALTRQRSQRALLSANRDSLNKQLPDMKAQRDAAHTEYERAQKALKVLCQDALRKAFPE